MGNRERVTVEPRGQQLIKTGGRKISEGRMRCNMTVKVPRTIDKCREENERFLGSLKISVEALATIWKFHEENERFFDSFKTSLCIT